MTRAARALRCAACVAAASALFSCGKPAADAQAKEPSAPKPASATAAPSAPDAVPEPLRAAWRAAHGGGFTDGARWAVSADRTYMVLWEPIGGAIPEAEPFSVAIGVARVDGAPLGESAMVRFDAEMPHHGHGMNLVPTIERRAPGDAKGGSFVASGVLLHMSGKWTIAVDVEEDGVLERAQWHVDIE